MEKKEIAVFTVRIESVENNTWQGTVNTEDAVFRFQSEMQLLRWLLKKYPDLQP